MRARLRAFNCARLCDVDEVEPLALERFSSHTGVGFASCALRYGCEAFEGVRRSAKRQAEQRKVLPSVSSWFGDAILVVDLAVEGACTDWAKPVDRPHHHTCWSVSDSHTDPIHAAADRPTRLPLQMMLACSSLQIRPS